MSTRNAYGEANIIAELTKSKGLNKGRGYTVSYCTKVMRGERSNEQIMEIVNNYRQAIADGLERIKNAAEQ